MSNETKSPSGSGAISKATQTAHATLQIATRDGATMERELTLPDTRIGKGPDNELILGDAAVSTNHALIRYDGQKHTLIDVGSRNGTFHNETRLTDPRELKSGDVIKLGHCVLTFRSATTAANQTITLSATEILGASAVPPPPPAPPTPNAPPLPSEDTVARALVHSKIVAQAEVDKVQKNLRNRRLYRALLEEKVVTELGLRDLMSRTFNLQLVDMRTAELDLGMAQKMKPQFLREKLMAPLAGQPGELLLAVADPTDQAALEVVKKQAGKPLSLRLATASEIAAQLDKQFVPRLIGVLPSGEKLEIPVNQQEIAIGKAPHNKVVLNDPTVSGTHAALIARDGGYSIVDLGSSNGTFVNGARVTNDAWTLQHGDKLQLGKVLLTFRNPAETVENKTARLSLEALEEIRRRAGMTATATAGGTVPPPNAIAAGAGIAGAAGMPVSTSPIEDEEKAEKKRRKKEKEKEKNSWLSASSLSRIIAQMLGALISLGGLIWVATRQMGPADPGKGSANGGATGSVVRLVETSWTGFSVGLFGKKPEASGVIAVPGSNGALIADDGRKNELLWMPLDEAGNQAGDLKPVPLNVSFVDAEAITYGNSYFYVITSQSDPAKAESNTLMRFAFDPQTQTMRGSQAEIVSDLRGFLLKNVPEISAIGAAPGLSGGLNIEGMAYDPNHERLLLGLRSPFVGSQAVLVPLKLINPQMPLSINNIQVDQPRVITLGLGGQGVRDITYDAHLKTFLIISGAPETEKKTDFGLWEWGGNTTDQPRRITELNEKYKPEGLTGATINGQNFVLVVGDAGSYLKMDYK
jgi:pSer/pThr/pTyr-binding forkhead associated (FHA) protein